MAALILSGTMAGAMADVAVVLPDLSHAEEGPSGLPRQDVSLSGRAVTDAPPEASARAT